MSRTSTDPRPGSSRSSFLRSISSSSVVTVQKDKPRLYVALYQRSKPNFHTETNCDSYHWSLIVGPQTSLRTGSGTRYHLQHSDSSSIPWYYEEQELNIPAAQKVLVRIALAKVIDTTRLESLLRSISVRENHTSFNCLSWVRAAFMKVAGEGGKCLKGFVDAEDWHEIEVCARKYVQKKRQESRLLDVEWGSSENVPTFNFWENRETTR